MLANNLCELAAIVRSGSISAAAKELATSQSALSRHLQQLEEELGACLLERTSSGVVLTQEGRRAYECALELAEVGEDLRRGLARTSSADADGRAAPDVP